MTNGTSNPGNKHCTHDWRITDTLISRTDGPGENPTFNLKCRRCGAETKARGRNALKALSARVPLGTGLG